MNKWIILAVFWAIYLLNYADRQVLSSVLPLIKQEYQLTDSQLGALSGVFFWVFAPQLIRFFTSDAIVVDYGVNALRIVCLGYFFY